MGCGNFFCDDCLTKVKGKNYCKECTAELLEKREDKSEKNASPQIIIQQQQQQQLIGGSSAGKERGSYFWLCFWLVVFAPVAVIYYFMRRWD